MSTNTKTFFPLGYGQNHLWQVQVDFIETETCNKSQVYNGAITPRMLCAGSLKGKRDACQVSGLCLLVCCAMFYSTFLRIMLDLWKAANISQGNEMYPFTHFSLIVISQL
jgi:hypothetical protein